MREIIFRGISKSTNDWVYGYYKGPTDNYPNVHEITTMDNVAHKVDAGTVGMYTGLKDKNGVRIFEDDVVKYRYSEHDRNGTKNYEFRTTIVDLYFAYEPDIRRLDENKFIFVGEVYDDIVYEGIDFEVTANIHQNPELINA